MLCKKVARGIECILLKQLPYEISAILFWTKFNHLARKYVHFIILE
jgi:hypothetical protein